jgi:hypothetical protein
MGHTSKPQPLVIARVFASLAPTMYLNMYSFGRPGNSCQAKSLLNIKHRGFLATHFLPGHLPCISGFQARASPRFASLTVWRKIPPNTSA